MNKAWTWCPLGELFEIGAGKTMSAAARKGPDKTPFLRTSNVLWDEVDISSTDEMSIPEHELHAKLLKPGDLLVCEGGEIGRAAIWDGGVEPMSFQNHLHRLRPIVPDVEPRFYVFFLQCAFTQLRIFDGQANKTTIPNLSRSRLASLEVPRPPLGEQQEIVAMLSQVRDALKVQTQAITVTQDLKNTALRILFTRGLQGEVQKTTEIGPVPKSWKHTTLGDLCNGQGGTIQTGPFGSQLHKHDYQKTGIPVVNPTHLDAGHINHENVPRVSDEIAYRLKRHRLCVDDLVFARRGQIGRMARVTKSEEGWLCGTGSFLVRARQPIVDNQFLHYQLSTEPLVTWLTAHAAGAIMLNLNNMILRKVPIFLPPIAEQLTIVTILNAIDYKIDYHQRKRTVLEELFNTLLNKLMTNGIRVRC